MFKILGAIFLVILFLAGLDAGRASAGCQAQSTLPAAVPPVSTSYRPLPQNPLDE
jgi:hypothetical protein